jgi:hypothetical protein
VFFPRVPIYYYNRLHLVFTPLVGKPVEASMETAKVAQVAEAADVGEMVAVAEVEGAKEIGELGEEMVMEPTVEVNEEGVVKDVGAPIRNKVASKKIPTQFQVWWCCLLLSALKKL